MIRKSLIVGQIVNILGIGNMMTLAFSRDELGPTIWNFSWVFSLMLTLISLLFLVGFSLRFLAVLPKDISWISSRMSPFMRFIFINPLCGVLVGLVQAGIAFDTRLLGAAVFMSALCFLHIFLWMRSVFLAVDGSAMYLFNYDPTAVQVDMMSVLEVKSYLFLCKVSYDVGGSKRVSYFLPAGRWLPFGVPKGVKDFELAVNSRKSAMGI